MLQRLTWTAWITWVTTRTVLAMHRGRHGQLSAAAAAAAALALRCRRRKNESHSLKRLSFFFLSLLFIYIRLPWVCCMHVFFFVTAHFKVFFQQAHVHDFCWFHCYKDLIWAFIAIRTLDDTISHCEDIVLECQIMLRLTNVWIAVGVEPHSFWFYPTNSCPRVNPGINSNPLEGTHLYTVCIQLKIQMIKSVAVFQKWSMISCCLKNVKYRSFSAIRLGSRPWIFQPRQLFFDNSNPYV